MMETDASYRARKIVDAVVEHCEGADFGYDEDGAVKAVRNILVGQSVPEESSSMYLLQQDNAHFAETLRTIADDTNATGKSRKMAIKALERVKPLATPAPSDC